MPQAPKIFIGTKKGAWILSGDASRRSWKLSSPFFFGNIVYHWLQDPRDRKRIVAAIKAGHLGHTVMVSSDGGRKWQESKQPPAFPQRESGRVVDHVFWLTPGHASEPGVWYAGTSPQGLFRSEDHGLTWESVAGFNEDPMRDTWCGPPNEAPPDGARMHSILVDPRSAQHLYLGMSSGGVFESHDRGASWKPLNKGLEADFIPGPPPEFGHDPHCMRLHPLDPDRLYQQNHCGIYRMDRAAGEWVRIGRNMPKKIGDIGFPMVLHPHDTDTAWVFPMDGTAVWPRTSIGGKPAVYRTRDGGKKWGRQDKGFPTENAWWTVFRQAMTADENPTPGLYLGNTGGEVWASRDAGASWRCIARHLPRIQSVEYGW